MSTLLRQYERLMPFIEERVSNSSSHNEQLGYINLDHDVGFLFHLTAVHHYILTGSRESRAVGLKAADVLLGRFQKTEASSYIRAWNDWNNDTPEFRYEKKGKAIIDSLMNVPLLFWATKETGNSINFDPATGAPAGGKSAQGYADESTWSRGHSWAIYGFALAYRYTRREDFRQAAHRCLDYWQRSLLANGDAPWDFNAPRDEWLPVDTSAMSITCCGILELYRQSPEDTHLLELGQGLANRLIQAHLAPPAPAANGFLLHGTVGPAYKKGSSREQNRDYDKADQCLIYGDYFFYDALIRLQQRQGTALPWDF